VNTKPQETEIHKNRENLVVRNSADSRSKIETTRVRNQIENRNEKLETKSRERNRSGVRIPLEKNYDAKMRNSKQRVEREIGPGFESHWRKVMNYDANQTKLTLSEEARTGVRNPNGVSHRTTYDPPHNKEVGTGVRNPNGFSHEKTYYILPIIGNRGPGFETHMVFSTDLQHGNAQ